MFDFEARKQWPVKDAACELNVSVTLVYLSSFDSVTFSNRPALFWKQADKTINASNAYESGSKHFVR